MGPGVLDTDVASFTIKNRLPPMLATRLIGMQAGITFVTLGELTKWSVMRDWGPRRREALDHWVAGRPVLPCTGEVARRWGELAAPRDETGPSAPGERYLDRRLLPRLRRATRDAQLSRLRGLR